VVDEYEAILALLQAVREASLTTGSEALEELAQRLEAGWLTPGRVWISRLEGMSPADCRALPPLLLLRVFTEVGHVDQARLLSCLRSQGWSVDELARLFSKTARWVRDLLKIHELPDAQKDLLNLGFLRQYHLRLPRR